MALPPEDPLIAELPPAARLVIGSLWHLRAESELRVGAQFSLLANGYSAHLPNTPLLSHLSQAAKDEARHSQLCETVGNRYACRAEATTQSEVPPLARFGEADEKQSLLLHLVLLSCVNEGTSTFYLREAMKHCRSSVARTALRQLLSDDVEHARIGWMHLASPAVTVAEKRLVSAALPTLLRLSRESWTSVAPRDEPWFVEHGCPGLAVARRASEDALRELVLPGLAHVGIDPVPAARWVDAQATEPRAGTLLETR